MEIWTCHYLLALKKIHEIWWEGTQQEHPITTQGCQDFQPAPSLPWLWHLSSSCDRKIRSVVDIHSSYYHCRFFKKAPQIIQSIFFSSLGILWTPASHSLSPSHPSEAGADKKQIYIWLPEINVFFNSTSASSQIAMLCASVGHRDEFNTALSPELLWLL